METYKKYFDIDPEFFPAVNPDLIKRDKNLWKKFYPHKTFVNLLKTVLSVVNRNQKLNIWVEGAYGTGKSHAVLTLKHLLDCSTEEVNQYFDEFHLDEDLRKKFVATKSAGKIITVHRYGTSTIHSDNDLFLAMQESIEHALMEAGIENAGPTALKDSIIKYLSNDENKLAISAFVEGSYKESFNNESVDQIIEHLEQYRDQDLLTLMQKIFKLANEKQIKLFSLDDKTMRSWIEEIINANNLKSLIFIWDEFTEYFSNNAHHLTGFQNILELSESIPFCFIPVTHKSAGGLNDGDKDKKKILGRFVNPTCLIKLPDNMAFMLMGKAMRKNKDEVIRKEWEAMLDDLEMRTTESRIKIEEMAEIEDKHLTEILPIHPYAACLLKYISTMFGSNQRSMFDFIKNDGNENLKGFQWFISNHGITTNNPFLSIDLLWGFFYENGKEELSTYIQQILNRYATLSTSLDNDEQRVLKAILLLQAMSENAQDVEKFLPSDKNLELAFEGTDLDNQPIKIANKMVNDGIVAKRESKDGQISYNVPTNNEIINNSKELADKEKEFESKNIDHFINYENSIDFTEIIKLPDDLKLRFNTINKKENYACTTTFNTKANKATNLAESDRRHFQIVVTFSKDESDHTTILKEIEERWGNNPESDVIYVDCCTPLGTENFKKWVSYKATEACLSGKNNNDANANKESAARVLNGWCNRIKNGGFRLYTKYALQGTQINDIDALQEALRIINKKRFPQSLESNFILDKSTWWSVTAMASGVEQAINHDLKNIYNNQNNEKKKLSEMIGEAWDESKDGQKYWENHPSAPISRIKSGLEDLIQTELKKNGRISIRTIYNYLTEDPIGFLPCSITAFFMGFLLQEYAESNYSWTNGLTTEPLSIEKMKEMVDSVIKEDINPSPRYRDEYIVTMTPEEEAFLDGTSLAFGLQRRYCSSIETTRDQIRSQMKKILSFPIWTLKEILQEMSLKTDRNIIVDLIEGYQNLANNMNEAQSDNNIANEIGKKFIQNPNASDDLHKLLTRENCTKGMIRYIDKYKGGQLSALADEIQDSDQYVNCLSKRLEKTEDSKWLWQPETVENQIDMVILEYEITKETGKFLGEQHSYKDAINAWIEKVNYLRLCYEHIKEEVGGIAPLLGILKETLKQTTPSQGLDEAKKETFLGLLKTHGEQFNYFYQNQIELFKRTFSFDLQGFSESDKEKVFNGIPNGCFADDKMVYINKVENIIKEFKKDLESIKIRTIWKEKTGTESPLAWSKKHKMPISSMISTDDENECNTLFNTLNSNNPSEKEVENAMKTLNDFRYWEKLNDEETRDEVFKKSFLKDYSTMLNNVDEVKDYLVSHISSVEPYNWTGSSNVEKAIEQLAQSKYASAGYAKAIEKIDVMNAEDVKKYLKDLIKNNMKVGIQIIKSN